VEWDDFPAVESFSEQRFVNTYDIFLCYLWHSAEKMSREASQERLFGDGGHREQVAMDVRM
jgi:hypothetical protein